LTSNPDPFHPTQVHIFAAVANENMLDNALTETRMCEVMIFGRHDASRYRE
jgi:hypothetical protein